MIGSARMNAKISATPSVAVNGSPMQSVTGLSPSGGLESDATASAASETISRPRSSSR